MNDYFIERKSKVLNNNFLIYGKYGIIFIEYNSMESSVFKKPNI